MVWGLMATIRRVSSIIGFFTPGLGLFNILYHWVAEQYPFTMRKNYNPLPIDNIQLFNMTENIRWKELDRASYEFPQDPAPPSYTIYTGFNLKSYVIVFFLLQVFNTLSLLLVKHFTSEEFSADKRFYKKFVHVLQCVNLPYPYVDWDQGLFSIEEFKRRYHNTEIEMAWSFAVNSFVSLASVVPIVYTGVLFIHCNYLYHCM